MCRPYLDWDDFPLNGRLCTYLCAFQQLTTYLDAEQVHFAQTPIYRLVFRAARGQPPTPLASNARLEATERFRQAMTKLTVGSTEYEQLKAWGWELAESNEHASVELWCLSQ